MANIPKLNNKPEKNIIFTQIMENKTLDVKALSLPFWPCLSYFKINPQCTQRHLSIT